MPESISINKVRAILFDVDGTLVDTVEGCVNGIHDTFQAFGATDWTRDRIRALVGMPLDQQMRLGLGEDLPISVIREAVQFTLSRYAIHQAEMNLFQESVLSLQLAHAAGIKIALVTSKNSAEVAEFSKKFGALDSVDAIICASDVNEPKPSPESAELACFKLGVEPENCLFVGDSLFDLHCARGAGIPFIAVSYGSTSAETFAEHEPNLLFHTPEALLSWLREELHNQNEKENRFIDPSFGNRSSDQRETKNSA